MYAVMVNVSTLTRSLSSQRKIYKNTNSSFGYGTNNDYVCMALIIDDDIYMTETRGGHT